MIIRKPLAGLMAGVALIGVAQASIVDHGDYLTDTASGMEWLDVTKSAAMTYSQVVAQMGVGGTFSGWRYATGREFNTLVANYTNKEVLNAGRTNFAPGEIDGLSAMLGNTREIACLVYYGVTCETWLGASEAERTFVTTGYVAEVPSSGFHAIASIAGNYNPIWPSYFFTSPYDGSWFDDGRSNPEIGSYLIRSTIPEPASLALLGLGLAGLAASRLRKQQ